MQLFNVGALELIFILLLAFIVLGPKKAVKTAGEVGQWIKKLISSQFWQDLMATSREIQDLPKKVMEEADIQKTMEDLDRSKREFDTIVKESGSGLQKDITKIEQEIRDPHHIHPDPGKEENK